MGATLNTASAFDAYVLSDRATWLALKNNLGDLSSRSRATSVCSPIWRDPGKSGQVSKCQKRPRSATHRLANLDGIPERHRHIPDQRPTTLSSGRERPGWLRVVFA